MKYKESFRRLALAALLSVGLLEGVVPKEHAEAADVYDVIHSEVVQYNSDQSQADWITEALVYAGSLYGVDPLLLTAVMETESNFHFDSSSSAGAIGLMQLMPATADAVGVDPYDPLGNVIGGASYLKTQLDNFAGYGDYAVTDAVAAYNAGGETVRSYGGCPPYAETRAYVVKVADSYKQLLANYYYR